MAERRNNLVTELAAFTGREIRFNNPDAGWIHIAADGAPDDRPVRIAIDGATVDAREAMRWLPAGGHDVRVDADGAPVERVVIRSVPELAYCKYASNPHIPEYGPYDWDFLLRHVLPHVNTVVGSGNPADRPRIEEWAAHGGKWVVECGLPGAGAPSISADEAYRVWASNPGMTDPLIDGILVDEFFGGDNPRYPAWTEAACRLQRDFPGKRFIPYFGNHWPDRSDWYEGDGNAGPESSRQFLRAVLDGGGWVSWERYLQERHTPAIARTWMDNRLGEPVMRWREVLPGVERRLIVALGYMTITETLNIHPSVDYKVFMDMQFQYLATHPGFDRVGGILEYTSSYADEETVRWAARLQRHYGIEGNTALLSDRLGFRYAPDHIDNPDFAHGYEGWDLPIWIEKSTAIRSMEGYSNLQGRWPGTPVGDTVYCCRRRADMANAIGQEIRNLVPGRLYSAKMIAGDRGDLVAGRSVRAETGMSLVVEGTEIVPEKTFTSIVPNNYAHTLGPFTGPHHYYFTYHQVVFRATSPTARLTISDWTGTSAETGTPAGPIGQEIAVNFVEVQPYWDGTE